MAKSRGPGRPPLPESERRRHRVRMQLSDAEYAGLLQARREGESEGAAARRMLFYDEQPIPEGVDGE